MTIVVQSVLFACRVLAGKQCHDNNQLFVLMIKFFKRGNLFFRVSTGKLGQRNNQLYI